MGDAACDTCQEQVMPGEQFIDQGHDGQTQHTAGQAVDKTDCLP